MGDDALARVFVWLGSDAASNRRLNVAVVNFPVTHSECAIVRPRWGRRLDEVVCLTPGIRARLRECDEATRAEFHALRYVVLRAIGDRAALEPVIRSARVMARAAILAYNGSLRTRLRDTQGVDLAGNGNEALRDPFRGEHVCVLLALRDNIASANEWIRGAREARPDRA